MLLWNKLHEADGKFLQSLMAKRVGYRDGYTAAPATSFQDNEKG